MDNDSISVEQKLTAHQYYLWLLSCQIPKDYWNTPEENQFFLARELTGTRPDNTDWPVVYSRLRSECPVVWNLAADIAKRALGLDASNP